uniref:Uncharacterized protein n=1 Tax=Solanum lycopersicum TaxID=4081 RepID=A0A3Q7GXJ1_SOLLC
MMLAAYINKNIIRPCHSCPLPHSPSSTGGRRRRLLQMECVFITVIIYVFVKVSFSGGFSPYSITGELRSEPARDLVLDFGGEYGERYRCIDEERANGCHLLQLISKNAGLDISSKNNNLGLDNLLECTQPLIAVDAVNMIKPQVGKGEEYFNR